MEIRPFIKEHGYIVFQDINNMLIGNQKSLSFINDLEGCYEGWVIASHHINKYPIETARTIKKYTNYLIEKNKIHRLQTAVLHSFDDGHRFAKFLGMEPEGLMKKYDYMEQDYMRYARVI